MKMVGEQCDGNGLQVGVCGTDLVDNNIICCA